MKPIYKIIIPAFLIAFAIIDLAVNVVIMQSEDTDINQMILWKDINDVVLYIAIVVLGIVLINLAFKKFKMNVLLEQKSIIIACIVCIVVAIYCFRPLYP